MVASATVTLKGSLLTLLRLVAASDPPGLALFFEEYPAPDDLYVPVVQKFLVKMGRSSMACPTTMATKSSRHDHIAAVGPVFICRRSYCQFYWDEQRY